MDDLRIFVRIIDDGGISAAAHRLNLSKSVISRRLRSLEERLGVVLLTRTTRVQRLTGAGRTFYERCVQILADLDEAEATVSQSSTLLSGTLRITAPLYFGQYQLLPAINDFLAQHENLVIDLDLSDGYANLVDEGFDLAIRVGTLSDSSLRMRRLMSVPLTTCASAAYLHRYGRPAEPANLPQHWGLLHRAGSVISDWVYEVQGHGPRRAKIKPRLVTNNDYALLTMAEQGHGIICVPRLIVEQSIAAGRLEEILNDVAWQALDVQIVYPPARHLSNRVRSFIDFLSARPL